MVVTKNVQGLRGQNSLESLRVDSTSVKKSLGLHLDLPNQSDVSLGRIGDLDLLLMLHAFYEQRVVFTLSTKIIMPLSPPHGILPP